MVAFLGLLPLPALIQNDLIPVVSFHPPLLNIAKRRALISTALQLPLWALVSFGAYLLFKLGWGVFTFNDVPEAHKELMAQIAQARTELKAKGVDEIFVIATNDPFVMSAWGRVNKAGASITFLTDGESLFTK